MVALEGITEIRGKMIVLEDIENPKLKCVLHSRLKGNRFNFIHKDNKENLEQDKKDNAKKPKEYNEDYCEEYHEHYMEDGREMHHDYWRYPTTPHENDPYVDRVDAHAEYIDKYKGK